MRVKIKKWLGITELECELNKLKNEKLVIMETINKIRNDVELLKKELTEIDVLLAFAVSVIFPALRNSM